MNNASEKLVAANAKLVKALVDLAEAKDDISSVVTDDFECLVGDGAEEYGDAMDGMESWLHHANVAFDAVIALTEEERWRGHLLALRRALPHVNADAVRAITQQFC